MTYLHDVFISHASEDKEKFVRPLAKELGNRGYDVWYDEDFLTVGDKLLDSINRGITNSRCGIVVLSYHFFQKNWPQKELQELTKLEKNDRTVILPILHEISLQEVSKYSEELAGKVAIKTSITTIEKIVDELTRKLGTPLKNSSITPQEQENKLILKDSEMDGLMPELSPNDITTLQYLLKISGFASSLPERRGLCETIRVDPDEINYLENTSSGSFATLLINDLLNTDNKDALCKICKKLDPKFQNGQYKKTLDEIKAKLGCEQGSEPDNLQSSNQRYKQTELYQALQRINSSESKSVEETLTRIFTTIQLYLSPPEPSTADTFTLYDPERGDRVAQRMADVISPLLLHKDEKQLSALPKDKEPLSADELKLLLLSAYLLDICLTPRYGKVSLYHHYLLKKPEEHGLSDEEIQNFQKWLDDEPDGVEPPLWQGEGEPDKKTKRLADRLITYYCYDRHKDWSEAWIEESLNQEIPDKRVRDNLILLCKSPYLKNKDINDERVVKSHSIQNVRLRYLIAVVRAANILAFDPAQIPDVILQDYSIKSTELIDWWKNDKYVEYETTVSKLKEKSQISFSIDPKKAVIHRASEILADEMDYVLTDCYKLLEGTDTKELWNLQIAVERKITPCDYEYIDGAFRPDTKKILELLSGIALYGDHLYAVRELLQNAFDAVREEIAYERLKNIEEEISNQRDTKTFLKDIANDPSFNLQHSVNLKIEKDSDGIWLVCTDDGVGMTKEIIQNYLLVSGSARQHKIINLERECQKYGFSVGRTGKFGIGVLSYFMLAERVVIKTRRSISPGENENNGWQFETEGIGSFGELTKVEKNSRGTEIRLLLKPEVIFTVISKKEDSPVQEQEIYNKNLSQEN